MGRADTRRCAWAWLLVAAAPVAGVAGEGDEPRGPVEPLEPGLLEFLAEEPALDEELGEALMTRDVDKAIERAAARDKVKSDGKDPI